MTDPFEVAPNEHGVVRVFTTDLDAESNAAITPSNVHRLLGDGLELDASRIEVFPSTVMEEMGLSRYLMEGYGIPEEDLQGTAAKLDLMKGLVIIVTSSAFRGQAATLSLSEGIRFIGAFREPGMAPPVAMAAPESAKGRLGPTGGDTAPETRSVRFWPIAIIALVIAAVVLLLTAL